MGIIYTSSPIFIILISSIFFNEKINLIKVIGLITCLIGVFAIIIKGDFDLLINLNFTIGDLWMLGAAIGWALYSIYLFYWKSELSLLQRFTLVSFFGALSLLPFYIAEEIFVARTVFNQEFYLWALFAAIFPGIIAFTLYTQAQKSLGASLTGFTLYVFTIYGAIYGYFIFDEKLDSYHYLGTALVFLGVYLARKNYETKRRNIFLEIIIGILVIYLSILILLFIFQRNLMYHPNENNYFGDKLEVEIEKVNIRTSDNINLVGWFHNKSLDNYKTILYFHGNAGKLENRIYKLNNFKDLNINF